MPITMAEPKTARHAGHPRNPAKTHPNHKPQRCSENQQGDNTGFCREWSHQTRHAAYGGKAAVSIRIVLAHNRAGKDPLNAALRNA